MKVAVIGAGVAGTAAAWAAAKAGAEVTLLHERAGSSALMSGAADFDPWELGHGAPELDADARELLGVLGFAATPAMVATASGVTRPTSARATSLLDLSELSGRRVAVADLVRHEWDASLLARALGATTWAARTGTRFEARALELDPARSLSVFDFAVRFDDATELEKLTRALTTARGDADGWLLGPWLGVRPGVAAELRGRLGVPVGEVLSPPGGVAGARFEACRDALLEKARVEARRVRVEAVERSGERWQLRLEEGGSLAADRVVLASGGAVGGGVVLEPARPNHPGGSGFQLSLAAPVSLEVDGQPIDAVSTLHGVDFASHGVGVLERVGVAMDGLVARGVPGLFVAGDAMADRPRTLLRALVSGLAAGRAISSR